MNTKTFRSYSPAFRYPLVIGKVNGLQLPFRFTVQQAATFLASIIGGFKTRHFWETFLPLSNFWMLITIGVFSVWVSWLMQYKQIEGRHPLAYATGWIKHLAISNPKPRKPVTQKISLFETSQTSEVETVSPPVRDVRQSGGSAVGWEVFNNV